MTASLVATAEDDSHVTHLGCLVGKSLLLVTEYGSTALTACTGDSIHYISVSSTTKIEAHGTWVLGLPSSSKGHSANPKMVIRAFAGSQTLISS